jgi:predicted Zn-dependent protease
MFNTKIISMLSLVLCLCAGCSVNPITGKPELMLVTESEDLEIGLKYSPEIEKQLGGKINDASLQAYINDVGQKIAAVSHRSDWEYHFTAVEDESVNAFALPGGYVYITKGLLMNLKSEAQLAAIFGHETVHIVARDTANMMSNQIGMNILLSAVTSEETSETVMTVANLTQKIIALRYSRKDEYEADTGGLDYMVKAGYDPQGMVETMQMLQDQQKVKQIEFLTTHPSPENRIGYLREKIQTDYSNLTNNRIGKEDYQRNVLNRISN